MSKPDEVSLIEELAARTPIAEWLGFSVEENSGDVLFHLAFDERHIGNALIRALHGGAIAAFLEFSAEAMLYARLKGKRKPSSINVDIDYLTSARAQDMTARVKLVRVGRRIAFVEAVGWQKEETSPVAAGRFRFRIGDEK